MKAALVVALLAALALARCRPLRADARATSRRSPSATRRSCGSSSTARECGPGEPYEPIDVDALFGEPTVALRGPWGAPTS